MRNRTKEGGFGTSTEFMRHLVRKDREALAEKQLEERLVEGLNSGRSRVPAKDFFKRMHSLIDDVAVEKKPGRRNGKATRSASRG